MNLMMVKRARRKLTTRILGTTLVSVVAGMVAAAAIFIAALVAFPLESVSVRGTSEVPKSDIERLVSTRSSLLTLNTDSLEADIEGNPWVEGATVGRDWRKREVVVDVDERVAVLRVSVDGDVRVLASDGTALPGDGAKELPVVELQGWEVATILQAAEAVEGGGGDLESVDSVGEEGITATVAGRSVLLSEIVEVAQIEALGEVFRENPEDEAVFDLRSPGRVIVSGGSPDVRADSEGEYESGSTPSSSETPAG